MILPTSPILPPNAQRLMTDDNYYVTENLLALRNTRIGNLMGLCGLTLPTMQPSCGISFLGAPMQEERLLRLGVSGGARLALGQTGRKSHSRARQVVLWLAFFWTDARGLVIVKQNGAIRPRH